MSNEARQNTPSRTINISTPTSPASTTQGHLELHGGLRGHSADAGTYPYRAVGIGAGDSWAVVGPDGAHYGERAPIHIASRRARSMKVLFPGGHIEHADDGRALNFSGTDADVRQRLAGRHLLVVTANAGRPDSAVLHISEDQPDAGILHYELGEAKQVVHLGWLQQTPNVKLTVVDPPRILTE